MRERLGSLDLRRKLFFMTEILLLNISKNMPKKHSKNGEKLKVDEKCKRAFNLGYEVAKELDLKTSMFQNESFDITLKKYDTGRNVSICVG